LVMRLIHPENVEDIALGAAVLGTGGGGDPYIGKLMGIQAIREFGPVTLLPLDEIDDDALIVPTAMMGAPTVMVEKLPKGDEIIKAFYALESYLGQKISATMSAEAGGLNSVTPLTVAARLRLPMVDCDGMGRAFPELQMVSATLYGVSSTPFAMGDEKGNSAILNTIDNRWTETFSRTITIDMGCTAMIACYATTGKELKEWAVPGTITLVEDIGRTIREARESKTNVVEAVRKVVGGFELFKGKIVDVQRRTEKGFARGETIIEGVDDYDSKTLKIQFQNENLVAIVGGEIVVSVPDLITVLETDTGEPITTEALRYGFRVTVLGIPCNDKWRTPEGLELVGPRYFGYDIDFVPIEERYGR
jgi:DUF917 family protein